MVHLIKATLYEWLFFNSINLLTLPKELMQNVEIEIKDGVVLSVTITQSTPLPSWMLTP